MNKHERIIRQLLMENSKVRKYGWRKAIREALLSDEESDFSIVRDEDTGEVIDDMKEGIGGLSSKLVPDAYRIESNQKILTMYEVEVTSGLTPYKLKAYCDIYRILDYYGWYVALVCICKNGIAQAYCLSHCYIHSLAGEVDPDQLTPFGKPYRLELKPLVKESVSEGAKSAEGALLVADGHKLLEV